jgi:hypothetical protein
MSTSPIEAAEVDAHSVRVTDDELIVELVDGRTISAPIAWFPRLSHGTPEERGNWVFIGGGMGIHWEDLDEDISVRGLLLGRKSAETQASLQKWLSARSASRPKKPRSPVRGRIDPNPGDIRYVRRDSRGAFTADQVDAARSLAKDIPEHAKTKVARSRRISPGQERPRQAP